ncbi:MAG: LrgB family protein [Clostridiales bacterium]|nr:LrgB family protein [Clostridiales bacterium]
MSSFLEEAAFFGVAVSLMTYFAGVELKKRFKWGFLNPLLLSIIFTTAIISLAKVDYQCYYAGAKYLSYLLTPATICLGIPLYEQFEILKKNVAAILAGIISGVITSLTCILGMALIFNFSHKEYVTFLPKSITTAIGMGVSEEFGGYVSVTVAIIIITGVLGNVIGPGVLKLFRIKEPVAKGIALGTAAHAVGTSKAMELGETEGAMSSLSVVVAGLLTVIGVSIFANFI